MTHSRGQSLIQLNDFRRQWADTGREAVAALERVGQSGWYILGASGERFEAALAGAFDRRHAVGCGNGLDALEMALRALGLAPGDEVLTTPLSAFATTLAIVRAGGVPVFVDVDAHGLVDLDRCEAIIAARSSIRAFVPVHLYGHPIDLDRLLALRPRLEVGIVEDCAQSVLARWRGRLAGTVGQAAATSFYPTKNLGALGDGGAVVTDDPALRARCASLRNYGQSSRYQHDHLGLNSRLDEVQAEILAAVFLPRLAAWTERRRQIATRYLQDLRHDAVRLVPPPPQAASAWHLFPVFVPAAARDDFQRHLRDRQVESAVHYPRLIPAQGALTGVPHIVADSLDNARRIAATEVSLPINAYLTDDEVDTVIAAVNAWRAP